MRLVGAGGRERRPGARCQVAQPLVLEVLPRGVARPLVDVAGGEHLLGPTGAEHRERPLRVVEPLRLRQRQVQAGDREPGARLAHDGSRDAAVRPAEPVAGQRQLRGPLDVDAEVDQQGGAARRTAASDVQQPALAGQGRHLGPPPEELRRLLHAHDVRVELADDPGQGRSVVPQPVQVPGQDPQLGGHAVGRYRLTSPGPPGRLPAATRRQRPGRADVAASSPDTRPAESCATGDARL